MRPRVEGPPVQGLRSFRPATGKQATGKQNAGESSVGHKPTVEHFAACVRIPNPEDKAVHD